MIKKIIELIGYPMNLGANRGGAELGPEALRIAGIQNELERLNYKVIDSGNINVIRNISNKEENNNLKNLRNIVISSIELAESVEKSLNKNNFPLILGGDHSMALGSLAGASSFCKKNSLHFGVIWIDAHADMNTGETSPSGNIHGMPLAASLGYGHNLLTELYGFSPKVVAENCALIGIRDVDKGENELIEKLNFPNYPMELVKEKGISEITQIMLENLKDKIDFLHVSFDIDSIDPELAPGVGTTVPNGFIKNEIDVISNMINETGVMCSLEVTEVNPILDIKNMSAEFAVNVVSNLLK